MRSIYTPAASQEVVPAEGSLAQALAGNEGTFSDQATALAVADSRLVQQQINSFPQRRIDSDGYGTATKSLSIGPQDFNLRFVYGADDWTPDGDAELVNTHSAGNNRVRVTVLTTGLIRIRFVDDVGGLINGAITPTTPFINGQIYDNVLTFNRSTEVITLYTNGEENGSVVATGTGTIDIGAFNSSKPTLYDDTILTGVHCTQEIYVGRVFTAAEVKTLAQFGTVPDDMVGEFTGEELITNGGFDTDLTGWSANGTITSAWDASAAAEVTQTYAFSAGVNEFAHGSIPVVTGSHYLYSCRVKSVSGNTTFRGQVDGCGEFTNTTITTEWTKISQLAQSSASVNASFRCGVAGVGSFLIDDVTITKVGSFLNSTDLNNPIQTQSTSGNEILWSDGGTEIIPSGDKAVKGRLVFRNVDCSVDTYLGGARDVLPVGFGGVTKINVIDESGVATTGIDVQLSDGTNDNDLGDTAVDIAADGMTPYIVNQPQILDDLRLRIPASTTGGTNLTFIVEFEILNN